MKNIITESLRLSDYGLQSHNLILLDERTIVVTHWDWDYYQAHQLQRAALKLVQETANLRILICCSHPEVLTNGRGLQRPKRGEILDLLEFKPHEHTQLPYPFFQIERGGGLTFHHPGQFIFYPIVKLNPKSLSLSLMIDQIFDFSIDILSDWGVKDLNHSNQLLGIWHKNQKLASMGIAIEKLTTFHGMALNILENTEMKMALTNLNPCGLHAGTYTSAEKLTSLPSRPLEIFRDKFLQRIRNEWK